MISQDHEHTHRHTCVSSGPGQSFHGEPSASTVVQLSLAGTDRQAADTWFPLSSLLWFQELLARGSGGAVGCGEPRADSRTAEQRELPTDGRYVPGEACTPHWVPSWGGWQVRRQQAAPLGGGW